MADRTRELAICQAEQLSPASAGNRRELANPQLPFVIFLRTAGASSSAVVRREPRERDELVPRTDVSATVEAQRVERDQERELLGILGPSRDAGVKDSRFDRGDLLCVVAGEQRAQPPDLLALLHSRSS